MAFGLTSLGNVWKEFKEFAFKGNMIDLAVAVVIGLEVKQVVDGLVAHLINPVIGWVTNPERPHWEPIHYHIVEIFGTFIHFVIVAAAVFLLVKMIKLATEGVKKKEAAAPTARECPFCLSNVPIKATKCAHCTSELPPVPAAPEVVAPVAAVAAAVATN